MTSPARTYHVHLHLGAPVSEDVIITGIIADSEHDAIVQAVSEIVAVIEFQSITEDIGPP